MDNLTAAWYTFFMDIQIERKKDGFAGEIYIVLPTEAFAEYAQHPLVRRLYLTDAGFFPHASHHYRERSDGIEEYIFLCCTSGRGVVEVDGQCYPLQENEAFCIPRLHRHRYWADEEDPWSLLWVHFKGEDCGYYPLESRKVCRFSSIDTVHRMEFLFNLLFHTLEQDYTLGNFIYLSQLLALILGETYARRQDTGTTALQNRQVTRAIRFMYRHLDCELTLAELSRAMGLSQSSLSAVFRRCTGRAPMDFFTRLKMKEACNLLRSGTAYVYEVAQRLGYKDPYYFSRAFKKVTGVSPRDYQNGIRPPADAQGLPDNSWDDVLSAP